MWYSGGKFEMQNDLKTAHLYLCAINMIYIFRISLDSTGEFVSKLIHAIVTPHCQSNNLFIIKYNSLCNLQLLYMYVIVQKTLTHFQFGSIIIHITLLSIE